MQTATDDEIRPARRWPVASALWLSLLAAGLALHVWFPRVDAGPLNDTYNVDVGGRNAFYQFAERRTFFASRNHESLVGLVNQIDNDTTLCLLGPARYPTSREWTALLNWVSAGGKLLLAARWEESGVEIPTVGARVTSTQKPDQESQIFGRGKARSGSRKKSDTKPDDKPENSAATPAKADAIASSATPRSPTGPVWTSLLSDANFTWKTEGVIDAPGAEILVKTGNTAQAVRIHHGQGTIVLVASDYIFSNAALYDRDRKNGALAVKLLYAAGATDVVLFDESLNSTGTPRVVGVLLDPALRPATIQLMIVLVIFGWQGNRRFGGLLPKSAPARHDVADHTNSLGNLYYKAHHSAGVLREYVEQLRSELRLRYAAGHEQRILGPLAQKANMSLEEVQTLLAEADTATRKPKLSRRAAASVIRRLAHLRQAAARKKE